jgi:hypothetical protein
VCMGLGLNCIGYAKNMYESDIGISIVILIC